MTHITTLLLLLITTTACASGPVPWFREKYLTQIYNEYYVYTFSRWRLEDNDRDICPEIHKPAVYFAITGQSLWPYTPVKHSVYGKQQRRQRYNNITQPIYDFRLVKFSAQEVVWFLFDFYYYCFSLLMILLSVLLATLMTIILYILVFGQY